MILIDRPCCDTSMTVESPVPDLLRCDDCAITWDLVDNAPAEVPLAA